MAELAYRQLNVGETLQDGDQMWKEWHKGWHGFAIYSNMPDGWYFVPKYMLGKQATQELYFRRLEMQP